MVVVAAAVGQFVKATREITRIVERSVKRIKKGEDRLIKTEAK